MLHQSGIYTNTRKKDLLKLKRRYKLIIFSPDLVPLSITFHSSAGEARALAELYRSRGFFRHRIIEFSGKNPERIL